MPFNYLVLTILNGVQKKKKMGVLVRCQIFHYIVLYTVVLLGNNAISNM